VKLQIGRHMPGNLNPAAHARRSQPIRRPYLFAALRQVVPSLLVMELRGGTGRFSELRGHGTASTRSA